MMQARQGLIQRHSWVPKNRPELGAFEDHGHSYHPMKLASRWCIFLILLVDLLHWNLIRLLFLFFLIVKIRFFVLALRDFIINKNLCGLSLSWVMALQGSEKIMIMVWQKANPGDETIPRLFLMFLLSAKTKSFTYETQKMLRQTIFYFYLVFVLNDCIFLSLAMISIL